MHLPPRKNRNVRRTFILAQIVDHYTSKRESHRLKKGPPKKPHEDEYC